MPAAKSILFVSHKANRSGAPVLLYNIIKAYKTTNKTPFKILLLEDGELAADFKELGKTFIWNTKKSTSLSSLTALPGALFARVKFIVSAYRILLSLRDTSLVFFNTITNGHTHKKLLFLKCKSICYVHELEAAIHMLTNKQTLQTVLDNTQLFLAVSQAVKNNLVHTHRISENKVEVVATPFAVTSRNRQDYVAYTDALFNKLKLKQPAVIIGLVAGAEWRKGFDLLVPLATIFFKLFPDSNVYFIWKGFRQESAAAFLNQYDLKQAALGERLIVLPHGNDSVECMAAFDIHLLLSREDPYPLVVLEAASFGIPTVCFANGGGTPEFVEDDAGYVVPYGDLLSMARCLWQLVSNNCKRIEMGNTARQKLHDRHNESKAMAAILNSIQAVAES